MNVIQINLQQQFGGGEAYTAFMCRALDALGEKVTLIRHRRATFWENLHLPENIKFIEVDGPSDLPHVLPAQPAWLMSHTYLPPAATNLIPHRYLLTGMAHMPIKGRKTDGFTNYRMVYAVSVHVLEGLHEGNIPAWPTPLYGIADLGRNTALVATNAISRRSHFDWDMRKGRDRVLSWIEPVTERLRSHPAYAKRAGITLGIVSRITTIKQFDKLFLIVAPLIQRRPEFHLEIFGNGGYASVRDLKKSLLPISDQVRFWGHQSDMRAVYAKLDYLMTGLPEKEALGLNVIEAQACDLPVLAIKAPPFTETVVEGLTGFFYCDPREDQGADFSRLLDQLQTRPNRLHPAQAADELARFSFDAFVERLRPVVAWAAAELREWKSWQ